MMPLRRTDSRVKLYFNCPEKMNRIERMCKYTNYEDMTVVISTIGERDLIAKHRIKFWKGWMGKDAGIKGVNYDSGGLKGIHILITISESIDVIDCWLKSPEGKIHLGEPTDIVYDWFPNSVTVEEFVEGTEENRGIPRREETDEEKHAREIEEKIEYSKYLDELSELYESGGPTEVLIRAGMKDVLCGRD